MNGKRNTMMLVGMAFLLIANLAHFFNFFVHPATDFAQDLLDGLYGGLFGIAIGCLLLSLRHRSCAAR